MASLPDGNGPGYVALSERVETALRLNSESPSVEFKAGGDWSTHKIDVIKTALAMSNLRDGGLIIIGRPQDRALPEGVCTPDLATFDPDMMLDHLAEYASPRVIVNMARFEFDAYKYVGIEVSEFDDLPVLCKKAHDPNLKRGGVYIRPFTGRPRSTIVTSAEEMRSVLELAIDKGILTFEATAKRRGYAKQPSDAAAYAAELDDLSDA